MLKLSHLLEVTDTSEHEYWMHHGLRDKIKKHLMDYEGHSTWKEHVDSYYLEALDFAQSALSRRHDFTLCKVVVPLLSSLLDRAC